MKTSSPPLRLEFCAVSGAAAGALAALREAVGIGLAAGALLTVVLYCFCRRKYVLAFPVFLIAALSSSRLHEHWRLAEAGRFPAGRPRSGEVIVRLDDAAMTGVPGVPPPRLIGGELQSYRLTGETAFTPVSGRIFLRAAPGAAVPEFGSVVRASGVFRPGGGDLIEIHLPDGRTDFTAEPGLFSFKRYLDSRGVPGVWHVREWTVIARRPGAMGALLGVRDFCMARVLRSIRSEETKKLAAAMFFGCQQGVEPETRRELVRGGVVHMFAVSGLHVGVLAGLLSLLLRPVPFRWRYGLLALAVFAYVLTTGANPPAIRAFVMIGVWCVLRMMLFRTPGLNVLAATAAVMLVLNPYNLGDIGFLYSFVITAVLLALAERARRFREVFLAVLRYVPMKRRRKGFRGLRFSCRLTAALVVCLAAFLGGSWITLTGFGLFLPGTVPANLLMTPVLAALFPVMGLKLLLGWIPGVDWLLAGAIEGLFELFNLVTALGAAFPVRVMPAQPPDFCVWIFYGAVALLFTARSRRIIAAALLTIAAIGIGCILAPRFMKGAVLLAQSPDGAPPMLAVAEPGAGFAVLINPFSPEAVQAVHRFLAERGIGEVALLAATSARSEALRGGTALGNCLEVGDLVTFSRGPVRAAYRERLRKTGFSGIWENLPLPGVFRRGNIVIFAENEGFRVEYFNPASNVKTEFYFRQPEIGGGVAELRLNGRTVRHNGLRSSILEIYQYEF